MKRIIHFLWITAITTLPVFSQEIPGDPLQKYILDGLQNNLKLQQKEADWKEASLRLSQARGLFYPDISLNARYTLADGGRTIDFPVGDLLNPVYSTLNMLTSSNRFTEVENEQFPFLRPKEQETKIRMVQPLLNTDIFYNRQIQKNRSDIQYSTMETYKRSLVFEIKQAYYNYLKAKELLSLLENTLPVLEENLRVNRSLYENDKLTNDVVLRSGSEILKLNGNIESARGSMEIAAAYFNFLLNRGLQDSIDPWIPQLPVMPADPEGLTASALSNREEIITLDYYSDLAANSLNMNKASRLPEIFAVVDYGYQGEEYRFTGDDDFVLASVVLKWDIFKGFQEKSKISEANVLKEKVDLQRQEAMNMIRLEVLNSWNELVSSQKKLEAARAHSATSSEIFRMIHRKYSQNQAGLLEFLDARNNMTMAQQEVIITTYDLLINYAALEKAAALFDQDNMKTD